MKKVVILSVFLILLLGIIGSIGLANAYGSGKNSKVVENRIATAGGDVQDKMDELETKGKNMMELRDKIRTNGGELRVEGGDINIVELSDEQKEIIAGRINAKTGLNLTSEDIGDGKIGAVLRAYLSNGRLAEVKIMPDRASETALNKLKARCFEDNCSVELKEVGIGNKSRLAYEINTEKNTTFLLFFKRKMLVRAQVDAETGEIILAKKPWWAFLAREKDANENEINEDVQENESDKKVICHIPPGNPNAKHTISVGRAAAKAHLRHGDSIGPCSSNNQTQQNNTNVTNPGNETQANKTIAQVNTFLNNTRTNVTISTGQEIYLNGTLVVGEGMIELYNDGVLINFGNSPLSNLTNFSVSGEYEIKTSYSGNGNFTNASEIWFVNVLNNTNSSG